MRKKKKKKEAAEEVAKRMDIDFMDCLVSRLNPNREKSGIIRNPTISQLKKNKKERGPYSVVLHYGCSVSREPTNSLCNRALSLPPKTSWLCSPNSVLVTYRALGRKEHSDNR